MNTTTDAQGRFAEIQEAYTAAPEDNRRPAYNPQLLALQPVIAGDMPLVIQVDAAKDILAAIDWVQAQDIQQPIFSGVREGWRVADKIAEAGIPCLVGPVLSTPTRDSDRFDKPYDLTGPTF